MTTKIPPPPPGAIAKSGIRNEIAALKRERIVEAAAHLFYERGFEQSTLDAVAERMGVTKPFIYSHFRSKAELLAEICGRGVGSSLVAIDAALASGASPIDKLGMLVQAFLIAVLRNQRFIAILAREEKNLTPEDFARLSAMRRDFDAKLVRLLDEGVAAGDFHLADTAVAALVIGGLVSWSYVWYRPHGRLSPDALADEFATLVLAMAGAR